MNISNVISLSALNTYTYIDMFFFVCVYSLLDLHNNNNSTHKLIRNRKSRFYSFTFPLGIWLVVTFWHHEKKKSCSLYIPTHTLQSNKKISYLSFHIYFLHCFFFLHSGIFAYLNYLTPKTRKEILDLLVTGLKRLEYRGYDSSGVAVDSLDGKDTVLVRRSGKVQALEDAINTGMDPKTSPTKRDKQLHTFTLHVNHVLERITSE